MVDNTRLTYDVQCVYICIPNIYLDSEYSDLF